VTQNETIFVLAACFLLHSSNTTPTVIY